MFTLSGKQHAVAMALNAHGGAGRLDGESETFVAHTLSAASAGRAQEDGTGRGSPLVVHGAQITSKANRSQPGEQAPALNGDPRLMLVDTLRSHPRPGSNSLGSLATGTAVRRLTPLEWERLMGLPDSYTLIPYPRKKLAADGPRYKAIGNSISVPTLRWIGRRIELCDRLMAELLGNSDSMKNERQGIANL